MKAGHDTKRIPSLLACGLVAALGVSLVACNGDIGGPGGTAGGTIMGGAGAPGGGGIPGSGGVGAIPDPPKGGTTGSGGTGGAPVLDAGRVSIHRLNNLEYDNTMRDLVGFTGNLAQTTFQPDEKGEFDNTADAFTINDARYEQYFNTADTIGEMVFASAPLKMKILTCAPTAATDACTKTIITNFGMKAWRRPLAQAEIDRLVALAGEATAAAIGETPENAIKHVVKTILASPQFLYRIEYDSTPTSLASHSLTGYELASRLSYLVWSSMPDDMLFSIAAPNGNIFDNVVLQTQVDRMLADPKGASFTESFAGQWLGARDMKGHQVEPTAFKSFDEPLRQAMIAEELAYFNQFLIGTQPMTKFFTLDTNFVNARLATHYGITPLPAAGQTVQVTNTADTRVGFLSLGSFLTFTSFSYRTAPTLRGKWVLLNLLCQTIPPPPVGVPKLDPGAAADPALQSQNVRVKLAAHRTAVDCAACHKTLDPIGLGLENFDAIGAYRMTYGDKTVIDSSGVLPSGETFSTVAELATILSTGSHLTQLTDCASEKLMTYALSRSLTPADDPYLTQVRTKWATENFGMKALLKDIVLNDTFRFRRGEM